MRRSEIERVTRETTVRLTLDLEGSGRHDVLTDCGFLDHMLELLAYHGRFDLTVRASGDARVDFHHLVEDVGIVLGTALNEALGDRRGIRRYGQRLLPMDEALVLVALDVSGRSFLRFEVPMPQARVGAFDTELVREFFEAVVRALGLTLHIRLLSGENAHHVIEAVFKGFGRALADASGPDPDFRDEIPSSKGVLNS